MLGQVGGRNDLLGEGDPVILKEDNLELLPDILVIVDNLGNAVEQKDDLLGCCVAGSSFAT